VAVVLKSKLKSSRRRAIKLAIITELCNFLKSSFFKVVVASVL
jgi:DNA-binding Xre family transcriptional regulator